MSNPYKRKAVTLATSFVIAGAGLSATAAVSAAPATAKPIGSNLVVNFSPNRFKGLKCDPRICNPAPIGKLNLVKRLRFPIIKPGLVNPAPVFRFKK